jgi:hypothetical protein
LPYALRPRGLRATVTALLGVAAILVVPAAASAACPSTPTTKAFAAFGDDADYSLVPGGSFNAGAPGWGLTNASVTGKSLAIAPTGVAVSPAVCVDVDRPTFRFFLRRTSGSWGVLTVKLRWQDASGNTNETVVAAVQPGTTREPSPQLNLARTLPLWNASQTTTVRLVFDPEDYGGGFAVDDVYIDPYARG